jgi:SCP-2 sterol transfer family
MAGLESGFFDQLSQRAHEPWLAKIEGTVRFDVTEGGQTRHWTLDMRGGEVAVIPEYRPADTVVHTDSEALDRMSRGQLRLLPAWLRNDIAVEGRLLFVLILERMRAPRQSERPLRGSAARGR